MAKHMNPWVGWALALVVAAGFCELGFWQLGRAQQKQTMLAEAGRVLDNRVPHPLSLANDAARVHAYDWAAGEGEFVNAPAILLDNQSRDDRAGIRAYRLFKPAQGAPLLIDLGWLPLNNHRDMPTIARPDGVISVQGLLAAPPSRGLVAAIATRQANGDLLVTALDAADIASSLDVPSLPPRVLRLDPTLQDIGYARDLTLLPNALPPEKHLSYAVQWFGLALALLIAAAILTIRRRRV
jgi:cytochrome oxidase assembly protein ShyY1